MIVGREGHMTDEGEYVTDRVKVEVTDEEEQVTAWAWGATEKEAREAAQVDLEEGVMETRRIRDLKKRGLI